MAYHCLTTRKTCRRACATALPRDCKEVLDKKGKYLGFCNRSACLAPDANWYNPNMQAFYCEDCARILNRENQQHQYWKLCHEGRPNAN